MVPACATARWRLQYLSEQAAQVQSVRLSLVIGDIGDEWRPLTSHMIFDLVPLVDQVGNIIIVMVHPNYPNAWQEPHFSQLRAAAYGMPRPAVLIRCANAAS